MRAKQLVAEGALGDVLGFRACYLHGGSVSPNAPARWKLTAVAGGGVIADIASHVLDLIDWLIGPFGSVMAATQIVYPERPALDDPNKRVRIDAEDAVAILARMPSGALGTIEATKVATGAEDELRFELHGTRGALRFNLMDPHHLEFHDATAPDQPIGGLRGWNRVDTGQRYPAPAASFPSPKAAIGWIRGHVACLANFLEAVAAGRPADPGLEQGIRVQHLMDCVRRSAQQRCWVDV
jgi:predicted dehydrogenase